LETPTNGEARRRKAPRRRSGCGAGAGSEQIEHLLLAVVAAPGGAVGRQAERAQLLLVGLGVRTGREEQDDLAGTGLTAFDQLLHPPRDVAGLGAAPVESERL